MAANLALAEPMAAAAAWAGVPLMVNWPTNWQPALHHAKRLIEEGQKGALPGKGQRHSDPGLSAGARRLRGNLDPAGHASADPALDRRD